MTRRLVRSYLAIALFVLVVLEVPLALSISSREYGRLEADVLGDATVVASFAEEGLEHGEPMVLPASLASYVADGDARIVVVDADGISVLDTGAEVPRDFSTRPEILDALAGVRATGRRASTTLDDELLYAAVPVASGGEVHGAVRITYATEAVRGRIAQQLLVLLGVAVVVLGATTVVALRLARWSLRPVATIAEAVERFGTGQLDARASVTEGPPEVVALARSIDDMADRIEVLVELQRGFASDASHQLRTPLTGLRLELENLESGASDETTREGLERAIDGTLRLSRMVDGLLTLARLEGRRPQLSPVDAAALAEAAHERWEPLAAEADVTLALDLAPAVQRASARGVADDLAQVLDVLLDNALAVSGPGTTVTIAGEVGPDGTVVLSVTDEGPGMPAADMARAFERSWQGDRATGSSGLGLAIARRLADANHARLHLEAAPGGGVRAVVALLGA